MTDAARPVSTKTVAQRRGAYDRQLSASERARVQRTQLVQAALELVLEAGDRRVTVEQVIRRAGMGRNTFYGHFENIEQLLSAVLQHAAARFDAARAANQSERSPTPTEALHDVARDWFGAVALEPETVRLMLMLDRAPLAACFGNALRPALDLGARSGLMARANDSVAIACAVAVGVELTYQSLASGPERDWPRVLTEPLLALLR